MKTASSFNYGRFCTALVSSVVFLASVSQTPAAPPPIITSDISVDLAGATSDGGGESGAFVKSGNVVISNGTLTNYSTKGGDGSGGGAGLGGAIFVNSGATVTLNNVNFLANTVTGGKGGVGTTGGTLNNLFGSASAAGSGASGYTPDQIIYTDIGGTTGTKGYNGFTAANSFGGTGGNGGAGGNGGDRSQSLILANVTAGIDLGLKIADAAGALANPFTINVGLTDLVEAAAYAINLSATIAALVDFDRSLANGQIGLGGSGGNGGLGGKGDDFLGGGLGGNGGNGGDGGSNWSGSAFKGGAAGGSAGNGGNGGIGGFGAGGGAGGNGGTGGKGAPAASYGETPAVDEQTATSTVSATYKTYYVDPDTGQKVYVKNNLPTQPDDTTKSVFSTVAGHNVTVTVTSEVDTPSYDKTYVTTPASPAIPAGTSDARPNGFDGSAGSGGGSVFGGGTGASGTSTTAAVVGGAGGNGFGGAIFVRKDGTLNINGDALFDQNNALGGAGEGPGTNTLAGAPGSGIGTDLFMMSGATVTLTPGIGHKIVFNGTIADDSQASGVTNAVPTGNGAGLTVQSGLVIFNGTDTYTGQTKISTGGVLQAVDGIGINANSNINLNGGILQSNGTITRYLGTDSNKLQWTADGGFSAQGGDLRVRLANNALLTWGTTTGFVGGGNKLLFGSTSATGVVTLDNAINLGGSTRTILVTANLAMDATDDTPAYDANIDNAILNGVISNGGLIVGDSTHTGVLILNKTNTYTSGTTINGGTLRESATGFLADSGFLTVDGSTAVFDLGADHSDTVGTVTLDHGGTIDGSGSSKLTSTGTFEMKDGTVNAILGGSGVALNKTGSGTVTLNAKNTYTGLTTVSGGTLLYGTDDALSSGPVTVNGGTLDMDGYSDTVGTVTLDGGGSINGGSESVLTSTGTFEMKSGTVNVVLDGEDIALNKTTSGTVTLNEQNTYTGLTTVSAGTLKYGTDDAIATGDVTIDGNTAILDMNGYSDKVGTVILDNGGSINGGSDSVLSSTGSFEMHDGTVNVVLADDPGTVLNKTTAGTVTLNEKNTYTGLTKITAGTLKYGTDDAIYTGDVTIDGATAVLDLNSHSDTVGTVVLDNAGTINGGSASVLTSTADFDMRDGTVNAVLGGEVGLNKTTEGTVTLDQQNTYTGLTKITAGTLKYGTDDAIYTGDVTIDGETAILDMNGHSDTVGTVTLDNAGTINGGSASVLTSTTTFELKDGTVNVVLGGEAIPLNKTTEGTVTLNQKNTYTGLTKITAGTLKFGTGDAIASGDVTIDGETAILDMNGHSDTVGTVTLDNGGTINGGSGSVLTSTSTFELKDGTVNVVLGGEGIPLNKTTEGTVTLNEQNTYTGLTKITEGTLKYGTDNAIASGDVTIDGETAILDMNGHSDTVGTVTLDNAGTINGGSGSVLTSTADFELKNGTVNVVLAGSVGLNKTTEETVTLNEQNTYTGDTNVNAGRLVLAGPSANLSTATSVTVATDAELVVNGDNTVVALTSNGTVSGTHTLTATTYNLNDGTVISAKLGNVSDSGGSTVYSNGNVTFSNTVAANTIYVQTGLLELDGNDLLSHSAVVDIATVATLSLTGGDQTIDTLNGDGTLLLNGHNLYVTNKGTFGGTTTTTGGLVKTGGGTLTLGGENVFTTGADVKEGTVVVDTGAIVTSPDTFVRLGATLIVDGTVTGNVDNSGTTGGVGTVGGNYTGNGTTGPGKSPGVLTVLGNYTENGTLAIELADASGPSVDNILGYDQVAVGGKTVLNTTTSALTIGTPSYTVGEMATATYIANAAAIAAFQPLKGQTFTIINSPGGISGHFATFTNNFTNDVIFNVSTGQLIGTGLLTGSTGGNLLNALPGADSNLQSIVNGLQVGDHQYAGGDLLPLLLSAPTTAAATTIANKASPEAYAGFSDYADRVTRNYTDDAVSRTPLVQAGKYSLFAGYANLSTGSSSSNNQADYDIKSNGGIAGARAAINDRFTVGLFTAFDSGSVDSTYLNSNVTGNVYGLFAEYAAKADRSLVLTASLSTATYSTDGTRVTPTSVSSFHGVDSSANLAEIGLRYRAFENRTLVIEPELRLTYVSSKVDGFTETNTNALQALNVHSQSNTSFTTEAAVNARYLATSKLSLNARLGVSYNSVDAARDVSANVVSETQSFTVQAPGMGDTAFNLGAGANYSITNNWSAGVSYQGAVASDAKTSNSFYVSTAIGF